MADENQDRLHERIDELLVSIGEVKGDVRAIREHCQDCGSMMARCHHATFGSNGDKGLTTRVASLEETRNRARWAIGSIAGLIGSAIGSLVTWLLS